MIAATRFLAPVGGGNRYVGSAMFGSGMAGLGTTNASAAAARVGVAEPAPLSAIMVAPAPATNCRREVEARVFIGRILRMRPVDAWGSVAGGMTSSSALLAVKRAADSNEPALAYAAAYACACVLVTMAGHVVIFLMT